MSSFEIRPLDLLFQNGPEGIASYLVIGPGGPVIVETGPGSTVPTLVRELARFGLTPADVRDVLVTHIHLDHAGAAGWWAQHGARIHVHHVGAPHLIDPSKLLASAQRIYGDTMQTLWGEFLPVPAAQVHALNDGDVVEVAGLEFVALDTPGHARHHMLYRLEDVAFTGDLAGIRLSARPYTRMPTPPPEFDLEAWRVSIARVRALKFKRLYLTHFGAVPEGDVDEHWLNVEALLAQVAERVREALASEVERETVIAQLTEWEESRQSAAGLTDEDRARYAGVGPVDMSVDGVIRYWNKRGVG